MQILPFDTENFQYTPEPNPNEDSAVSEAVLQSYPVVIATVNSSGPIPTAFTNHMRPRPKKDSPLLGLLPSYDRFGTSDVSDHVS